MSKKVEKKSIAHEFLEFIQKYGVLGLAIGVVTGGAVKTLVDSLVTNLISPLLAKVGGLDNLKDAWIISGFKFGAFTADLINFLILMLVIFLTIKFFIGRFLSEDEHKKI